MRGEGVEKRGERGGDPHPVPDNRCAAATFTRRDRVAGATGGVVRRAADRHPDVVDQSAPCGVQDAFGDPLAPVLGNELRQKRRRRFRRSH